MTSTVQDNELVLQEACDRNIPLEIHYVNPNMSATRVEADMLYAQTRLIGFTDKLLYLDSPQSIGKAINLRHNRKVSAYFTIQGETYTFLANVVDLNCLVELNRKKRIVGMCLSFPTEIKNGQRREDHRLSVVGINPIIVALHTACPNNHNAAPIDAVNFTGQVVNLSRGGVSLLIEGAGQYQCTENQLYYLRFALPEDDEEMTMLGELRNIKHLPRTQARRCGFQFWRWPDSLRSREMIGRLGKFLLRAERRVLQSRRQWQ